MKKGKILDHSVKAYSGKNGIVPSILKVGARYRGVVCFTRGLLYVRGETTVPT